jgi:hypothetical protein
MSQLVRNFVKQIDAIVFKTYYSADIGVYTDDFTHDQEKNTYTLVVNLWTIKSDAVLYIDLGAVADGKMTKTLDQVMNDLQAQVSSK